MMSSSRSPAAAAARCALKAHTNEKSRIVANRMKPTMPSSASIWR
jgi:hypothetical protein